MHGDYDVDGVCSTAVLVRALRALRRAGRLVPARPRERRLRRERATVTRLAERGTRLLIAVDCGITAAAELAAARAAGMDVIVADHHTPPRTACREASIVHPLLCGYPCAELCATAVAYKLALALAHASASQLGGRGRGPGSRGARDDRRQRPAARREPYARARAACARSRARTKPGLRALMARARVDPSRVDERAVSFGLAPRLNAAGRLYRADAALELVLTEDPMRAAQIAERARPRQPGAPRRRDARALRSRGPGRRAARQRAGYVLAGEGWHAGVIGIVASRLVERHHRPFALVALEGRCGQGLGAQHRGLRPDRRAHGMRRAPAPLRRPPGGRGPRARTRARSRSFAAAFDAHAARDAERPRTSRRRARRRACRAAASSRSSWPRSCARSRPSARATRRSRCSLRAARVERHAHDGGGQAPALHAARRRLADERRRVRFRRALGAPARARDASAPSTASSGWRSTNGTGSPSRA